jgi:hypothetical protein
MKKESQYGFLFFCLAGKATEKLLTELGKAIGLLKFFP